MWPDNPDDVARLFYLLLLLAGLLGFFLVGGRQRLGATLQQLLIWVLIFAMAIIAYGFRDTLRGALFPASAVLVSDGTIELRRASDGHFHATLDVDGVPVRFVVDTGATDIVLARADAERIGIDVDGLAFTGRAMTANGPVATARVRLGRVSLSGLEATGVPASVTASALDTSLLGMAYLDRFARIEIAGDRMLLSY
jgi:aspartyl protease family protein